MKTSSKALIPYSETTTKLIKEVAQEKESVALMAVLERMTQLETISKSTDEIVEAATDLVANYTVPGKKRFKRVVKLRKAIEKYHKLK